MRCSTRNCNRFKDVNPVTRLCPACQSLTDGNNRRYQNQTRQSQARAGVQDLQRDLNVSLSPVVANQVPCNGGIVPPPDLMEFFQQSGSNQGAAALHVNPGTSVSSSIQLPEINLASVQNTYNEMLTENQPKAQTEMFAMLIHILSNQRQSEELRAQVDTNTQRIAELEAKVGGPTDISEKNGLCIRKLPFPPPGVSELVNIRNVFSLIQAPGVDPSRDVLKATRVGQSDNYLGILKVEMRDDHCRASIMKAKKNLQFHQDEGIRGIVIQNLRSNIQMTVDNFTRDLFNILPGCNNLYMAPNGRIRRRDNRQYQEFSGHNQPTFQAQRFQDPSNTHLQPHVIQGPSGSGQPGFVPAGNNNWSRIQPRFHQPPHNHQYSSDPNSHHNLPQAIYVPSGPTQPQSVASTQSFDPLNTIPTGIGNFQSVGFVNQHDSQPQASIANMSGTPVVPMPPQTR